jgi:tetratricopeptide (TPR) repeat protein
VFRTTFKFASRVALLGLLFGVVACATSPRPVTKIVGNRIVVTRAVNPYAYEHAARALLFENDERWEDAVVELREALAYDKRAPELHARLADVLIHLDNLDEAESEILISLDIEPTAPALLARGHLFLARGEPRAAAVAISEAVALTDATDDPEQFATAHVELAEVQIMALDLDAATSALLQLHAAVPTHEEGLYRLAAVYWATGATDDALRTLDTLIGVSPYFLEAHLLRIALLTSLGQSDAVIAGLKDALARSEDDLQVATLYVDWLVDRGLHAEAIDLVERLLPTEMDHNTVVLRMELERTAKRPERALELAKAVQATQPEADLAARVHLAEAMALEDLNRHKDAVTALLQMPEDSPLYLQSRLAMAELQGKAGETTAARTLLQQLAANAEDDAMRAKVASAHALFEEKYGTADHALGLLEKVPGAHANDADIVMLRAAVLERKGNWQAALKLGESVLRKDPANPEALNFSGFIAADHKHNLPQAERRCRAALALNPGSAAILDSVGWARLQAGDKQGAAIVLRQAVRLDPKEPELQGHLAALLEQEGNTAEAMVTLQNALKLDGDAAVQLKLKNELTRLQRLTPTTGNAP